MSEASASPVLPFTIHFPHSKEELRRIPFKDEYGQYEVYRISPAAANWPAEKIPDGVNPRSHDEECLDSKVARDIEKTLREEPEDFWLANRGGFLLAEKVKFDPDRGEVAITLSDEGLHGMADGATTNKVIAKLRKEWEGDEKRGTRRGSCRCAFQLGRGGWAERP
jgi:AIPR protein